MNSSWQPDSVWMQILSWLVYDGPAALGNHLWQSTLFALAIGALAWLLRGNRASVRHVLWLLASLKFLLPFSLLALIGAQIPWTPDATTPMAEAARIVAGTSAVTAPLDPVADHWQLLAQNASTSPPLRYALLLPVLTLCWALGALFVAARWLLRWREARRIVHAATPTAGIDFPAAVRTTSRALEPGLVGVLNPVLLLPAGIAARLAPEQLQAVLAHERCHLQRRDNLTASLHMLVEALFWFHPLVWWIGARMIDERERACDEQVVREGHAPDRYAEAILQVCEHYLASRLPCVAGVSGSNLRQRVERIARRAFGVQLDRPRQLLLASLAGFAVAIPFATGIAVAREMEGRSMYRNAMMHYWSVVSVDQPRIAAPPPCADWRSGLPAKQRQLQSRVAQLAAQDGSRAVLLAVLANSATDTHRLLAAGAPRDGDPFLLEDSLMHVAAQFGDPALLQVLADAGIAVDSMASPLGGGSDASYARTPLMAAISLGRQDNIDWFLRHGADVNAANRGGQSVLSHALVCRDQQLITQLVDAGAMPTERQLRAAGNIGIHFNTTAR